MTILSGLRDGMLVLASLVAGLYFFWICLASALMSLTRVSAFRFLDGDCECGGGEAVVFVVSGLARRLTITIFKGLRKLGISVNVFCRFGASACGSSMRPSASRFSDAMTVVSMIACIFKLNSLLPGKLVKLVVR